MTDVSSRIFVGRRRELAELRAGLGDASDGRGRLFLVSGEAGMGKSRLAAEAAESASARGFRALWGRCWESGGAPAFWPWRQILSAYLRSLDDAEAAAMSGAAAPELSLLAPEMAVEGAPAPTPGLDSEKTRFRFFELVGDFLRRAAARRPLLLLLDDLHAADPDSMLLLRFLARDLQSTHLILVATYREVEAQRNEHVAALLADLLREGVHLSLGPLSEAEVGEFLATALRASERSEPTAELAASIVRLAEGNPLFVGEIVRLWLASGSTPAGAASAGSRLVVPEGVREVVRRRLQLVDRGDLEVLRRAAVIGREFDGRVLERVVIADSGDESAAESVRAVLRRAMEAALVQSIPGDAVRSTFSHALFRDTLYHDLDSARRAHLHRTVAGATEEVFHAEIESRLEDVAHHHLEAASDGRVDEAVHYAGLAAAQAERHFAFENALVLRRRALKIYDGRADAGKRGEDALGRCRLLLDLGSALETAGHLAEAKQTFLEAAEVAERESAAPELARAAIGFGGAWLASVEPAEGMATPGLLVLDDTLVRLLRAALDAFGDAEHPLRAQVLARLAVELNFTDPLERRRALAEEAIAIARASGDRVTLARVLCDAHTAIWHLSTVDERSAMADEILELAAELRVPELELAGRGWRIGNLFEAGDCAEMEAEVDRYRRAAERSGQRRALWLLKTHLAMRALLTGSYEEGKRLSREALEIGDSRAGAVFAIQLTGIRRELGELEKLAANEATLRWAADAYPMLAELRVQVATLLLLLGRREEAQGEFDRIAAHGFADVRLDPNWANTLCEAAEVAAELEDRERARQIYELLRPYERRNALGILTTFSWGSIARTLGRLATCFGNWRDAASHFAVALEANRALRARPWVARTECDLAEMLLRRADRGDESSALDLLESARSAAETLGMRPLVARCAMLTERAARATRSGASTRKIRPSRTSDVVVAQGVFRREGDVWRVEQAGRSIQLRHQRGLAFLARLLAEPGREISALDLVASTGSRREGDGAASASTGPESPAAFADSALTVGGAGDAGEHIDARALADYRRRAGELAEELAEAEERNDIGRAERVREEMEAIAREMGRAVGLGGRLRRAGSPLERARINVTRAVSDVLKRIRVEHPEVGLHLTQTIRTGTFCSYRPDPRAPIVWLTEL